MHLSYNVNAEPAFSPEPKHLIIFAFITFATRVGFLYGRRESNRRNRRTPLRPMHLTTKLWSINIGSDINQPQLSG